MKTYSKTSYVVSAEIVAEGATCYNFLEQAHYTASNDKTVVMTGTAGEQWMMPLEKFCKTYMSAELNDYGTHFNPELREIGEVLTVTPIPNSETIFAEQTSEVLCITTAWGDKLTANAPGVEHGNGDYIVYANKDNKPNMEDCWVVNGLVFESTYKEV